MTEITSSGEGTEARLFDHPVGADQHYLRDRDSELPGGPKINNEFDLA